MFQGLFDFQVEDETCNVSVHIRPTEPGSDLLECTPVIQVAMPDSKHR